MILLLSVLHIPVHTHQCHLFNKTETTLFSPTSCCCADMGDEILDFKCCSSSVKVFVADHESTIDHSDTHLVKEIQLLASLELQQFVYKPIAFESDIDVRPPPLTPSGRSTLIRHQVFRI